MMDEIDDRQQQAKAAEQIAAAAAKGRRQRVEAEHIAAAAAKGRRQRVEVIIVLEKHDEFHLRIRNIIDELVEQFVTITKKNDIDERSMLYSSIYDQQQQAEALEQNAAVVLECRRQRVELISTLKQHDPRTRNKIDELVEEFLTRTKDDLYNMLCDNKDEAPDGNDTDDDDDDDDDDRYYIDDHPHLHHHLHHHRYYRGLDSNRDTEAEVETALRLFPEVLLTRGGPHNYYPIQYIATNPSRSNVKALPFISLLARLAIEFGSFEKKARGGLLYEDKDGDNILQFLVRDIADDAYLHVMIQLRELRQMGYFKKEDIKKYGLVVILCRCRHVIRKKIFRFLVEWDPTSLIQIYEYSGHLPLHVATKSTSTLQDFRMVFKYGIRYYPKKKGISLLFKKNDYSTTTFQRACTTFKYEAVIKIVEDILIRYSDTPINTTEALITAAIDEDIHLDCVYFLLRREPDVVMKLMPSSSILTSLKLESTNDNILIRSNHNNSRGSISDNDMHSVNNNDDLMAITSPKKRNRKERNYDQVS